MDLEACLSKPDGLRLRDPAGPDSSMRHRRNRRCVIGIVSPVPTGHKLGQGKELRCRLSNARHGCEVS
jgi:hypothetical protein